MNFKFKCAGCARVPLLSSIRPSFVSMGIASFDTLLFPIETFGQRPIVRVWFRTLQYRTVHNGTIRRKKLPHSYHGSLVPARRPVDRQLPLDFWQSHAPPYLSRDQPCCLSRESSFFCDSKSSTVFVPYLDYLPIPYTNHPTAINLN